MTLPSNPAFAKANSRDKEIPDHLKKLLPAKGVEEIAVGTGQVPSDMVGDLEVKLPAVFEIYPLPFAACNEMQDEIQKVLDASRAAASTCVHGGTICAQQTMICTEKNIQPFPAPNPCRAYECPYFTAGDSDGPLSIIMKTSGITDRLVSYAVTGTGEYVEFFRKHMTIQQRFDALSKIWDMNATLDVYSEGVRKNVMGLLRTIGLLQETEEPPMQSEPISEESKKTSPEPKSPMKLENVG